MMNNTAIMSEQLMMFSVLCNIPFFTVWTRVVKTSHTKARLCCLVCGQSVTMAEHFVPVACLQWIMEILVILVHMPQFTKLATNAVATLRHHASTHSDTNTMTVGIYPKSSSFRKLANNITQTGLASVFLANECSLKIYTSLQAL